MRTKFWILRIENRVLRFEFHVYDACRIFWRISICSSQLTIEFLNPGIHLQFLRNNLILENRAIIKDFLINSGYLHVTCKNVILLFITYHRGNRFCWPCLFFMKTVVCTLKPKPTTHKQAQNKKTNKYQIWSSITHNNWAGMPA